MIKIVYLIIALITLSIPIIYNPIDFGDWIILSAFFACLYLFYLMETKYEKK